MKRFSHLLLLTASFRLCALVAPIAPDEGVWNVITRLGTTIDAFSTGGLGCDIIISQSDIGGGGIYTISGSDQTLCLSENITFTFGDAIEIAGSNIILDLNNKVIDGQSLGARAIKVAGGARNIIIKNGTVKNAVGVGAGTVGTFSDFGGAIANIVVASMNFYNAPNGIDFAGFSFDDGVLDRLLIEDCNFFDCGDTNSGLEYAVVVYTVTLFIRRCVIDDSRTGSDAAWGVLGGGFTGLEALYTVIEDCIITGTNDFSGSRSDVGIFLESSKETVIKGCFVSNKQEGIRTATPLFSVTLKDCMVENCPDFGIDIDRNLIPYQGYCQIDNCRVANSGQSGTGAFYFTAGGGAVSSAYSISNCIATQSSGSGFNFHIAGAVVPSNIRNVVCKNCCAQDNAEYGFEIDADTVSPFNYLFDSCVSMGNGGDGFALIPASSRTIFNVVFRDCVSQNNLGIFGSSDGDGFAIGAEGAGSARDIIFERCIAQGNAGDGFDLGSSTSLIKVIDCTAKCNAGIGFNNAASASDANFFFGNSSIRNGGGDYTGITDSTKIVSFNFPGAFMGAGRWVNAST